MNSYIKERGYVQYIKYTVSQILLLSKKRNSLNFTPTICILCVRPRPLSVASDRMCRDSFLISFLILSGAFVKAVTPTWRSEKYPEEKLRGWGSTLLNSRTGKSLRNEPPGTYCSNKNDPSLVQPKRWRKHLWSWRNCRTAEFPRATWWGWSAGW